MLLEHFDSQRSLSRDHGLIVKGMNERQLLFLASPQRFLASFVVICAGEDNFGAVSARGGPFHQRRRQRHADLRLEAALRRVIRHRLRVVTRGRRDHPPPPFFLVQHQNLVQRASFLERACHLQIFELQENRVTRLQRKFLGVDKGCEDNRPSDAVPRILDRAKCQHRESSRSVSWLRSIVFGKVMTDVPSNGNRENIRFRTPECAFALYRWAAQIGTRPTITRTADISTGHRTYLNVATLMNGMPVQCRNLNPGFALRAEGKRWTKKSHRQ